MSNNNKHDPEANHSHHILADAMAFKILGILLGLTLLTVITARIDLGSFNFAIAMVIASVKASIVCMFFMGLKYDHKENTVIFSTSLIFLSIFMILTFGDLLTRGNVYVQDFSSKGAAAIIPEGFATASQKSKFTNPWVSTPELVAAGKEQFKNQCVTCHGDQGMGNGPAAAALTPKPRNFTSPTEKWTNGFKPSQIFYTITNGSKGTGMAAFSNLSPDDRWALVHYVRSLGPHEGEKDAPADLAKIGIDPTKGDGGGATEKVISINQAIDAVSDGSTANSADAPAAKAAKTKK